MSDALVLPRRLAIALMAEAQKAAGAATHGIIAARDGVPVAVQPNAEAASGTDAVWARYRSGANDPDPQPGRQLLISIDTKGVLQVRCWERDGKAATERELHIL